VKEISPGVKEGTRPDGQKVLLVTEEAALKLVGTQTGRFPCDKPNQSNTSK
jgi:hypothetical protein